MGAGINRPSTALALNTYFRKRRGIATGLTWTATGLSPVLMPQLISVLMDYTDVHGTVLILAGITLHTIPMALLLQPAHWHGRWVPKVNRDVKRPPVAEERKTFLQVSPEGDSLRSPERKGSLRRGQVEVFDEGGDCIVDTQSTLGLDVAAPISRQASVWSLSSTRGRLDNRLCEECQKVCEGVGAAATATPVADDDRNKSTAEARGVATGVTTKRPKWWKRMAGAIVDFFDLTLLQDPKFVVIFVGMTLGFVAEINFALLVPFIYSEFGYSRNRVALFMSTLATVDLLTRFTVPFITDRFKMDPKVMYGLGLMILSTGRIGLAHLDGFNTIMAVTVWLGFGKGLRTVFMALVIPSYVPLHRLPSASGLQMMSNGIIFICVGPLFGHLRDSSTSYATALHCLNLLTFGMVALWTVDYLVERTCRRNNKEKFSDIVM